MVEGFRGLVEEAQGEEAGQELGLGQPAAVFLAVGLHQPVGEIVVAPFNGAAGQQVAFGPPGLWPAHVGGGLGDDLQRPGVVTLAAAVAGAVEQQAGIVAQAGRDAGHRRVGVAAVAVERDARLNQGVVGVVEEGQHPADRGLLPVPQQAVDAGLVVLRTQMGLVADEKGGLLLGGEGGVGPAGADQRNRALQAAGADQRVGIEQEALVGQRRVLPEPLQHLRRVEIDRHGLFGLTAQWRLVGPVGVVADEGRDVGKAAAARRRQHHPADDLGRQRIARLGGQLQRLVAPLVVGCLEGLAVERQILRAELTGERANRDGKGEQNRQDCRPGALAHGGGEV